MKEFLLWLKSVFGHWKSGVSGGGGILLSIYTIFIDQDLPTKVGFITVAIICLGFAFFISWKNLYQQVKTDEQKAAIEKEKELQREKRKAAINDIIMQGHCVMQENIFNSPGIVKTPNNAPQPRAEDIDKVRDWIDRAEVFVRTYHPNFIGQFLNADGMLISTPNIGKHHEFIGLYEKMYARIDRLGVIQNQI